MELAKAYYDGLTESMIKNFNGTEVIASMQQCNEFFFLATKQISIGRVGNIYKAKAFSFDSIVSRSV